MCLAGAVVRILSQDHHLNVAQFREAKGVKHIFLRRVDRDTRLTLASNSVKRIDKVRLLFLISQHIVPG
ncbi:hypothetical protein NGUA15_02664 [Salmonella enterica]|nr:hypothetical protein NGUA15_02664 [Salmonella enterica]